MSTALSTPCMRSVRLMTKFLTHLITSGLPSEPEITELSKVARATYWVFLFGVTIRSCIENV